MRVGGSSSPLGEAWEGRKALQKFVNFCDVVCFGTFGVF